MQSFTYEKTKKLNKLKLLKQEEKNIEEMWEGGVSLQQTEGGYLSAFWPHK
jgi:hypothetical protein